MPLLDPVAHLVEAPVDGRLHCEHRPRQIDTSSEFGIELQKCCLSVLKEHHLDPL